MQSETTVCSLYCAEIVWEFLCIAFNRNWQDYGYHSQNCQRILLLKRFDKKGELGSSAYNNRPN